MPKVEWDPRRIRRHRPTLAGVLVLCCAWHMGGFGQGLAQSATENWPQWRGPYGTGVAAESATPPLDWSEAKNVRWKAAIPGLGHSSPVIWGNHVFVTSAIPIGPELEPRYSQAVGAHDNLPVTRRQQFVVLDFDRATGKLLWQTAVHESLPHDAGHFSGSLASASAVTDADYVIASFGSYGLYCLDHSGSLVWEKQLGIMQSKHGHGEGSSPAIHGDSVVVNWDHEGKSFVTALDRHTGKEIWRQDRDEVTSWASPLIVKHDAITEVILCGTHRVRAYNLVSGEVIWECGGLSANVVATPVAADGLVFVGSSYETRNLLAIRLQGAHGDLTDTDYVVWSRQARTPYVPSPLLYGKYLYFLRHYQGILSRVEARSGEETAGPFRLGALQDIYASPVGAQDRIYVTDLRGVTQVLSHSEIPRPMAVNSLDDSFSASAAIVGDAIFLRGRQFLYCLAEPAITE